MVSHHHHLVPSLDHRRRLSERKILIFVYILLNEVK